MEQENIYLELCEKAVQSISLRCNCDIDTINLQTETETVTKGNLGLFGHILFDLHEQYNVPMTYDEFTQYEIFPTVEAVVNHFYEFLA